MIKAREKELEFHFDPLKTWTLCKYENLSGQHKKVDFVVEQADRVYLIEVKDPSLRVDDDTKRPMTKATRLKANPSAIGFMSRKQGDLEAKCYDTAHELHPAPRQASEFWYVVVVELEELPGHTKGMLERWREIVDQQLTSKFLSKPPTLSYKGCIICDAKSLVKYGIGITAARVSN